MTMTMPRPNLSEFEVRPDAGGEDTSKSYPYMYWRRADGWIVIGPAWATEFVRQSKKGMQPLTAYGEFHKQNKDGWNSVQEPWRRILQLGGAHEFPLEQVREHGWHRKPPYLGVAFPQLDDARDMGALPDDVQCPTCRKPYLSTEDLQRHELIAHKEQSSNTQLARALAEAQQQGLTGPLAEVLTMLAQTQQAMLQQIATLSATQPAPARSRPRKEAQVDAETETEAETDLADAA